MATERSESEVSEVVEFGPRLWGRVVIGILGMLLLVLWIRELMSSYYVMNGYISVEFFVMICVTPLIVFIVYWTSKFSLDQAPTLVLTKTGFSYRVAFHEFGRFTWNQVADFSRENSLRHNNLLLLMAEPGIVSPPNSWVTMLLNRLGSKDEPSWLLIPNLVVGWRLDEVEALFETHVGRGQRTP